MLTETTTTTLEPAFEISNYKIKDEDLPGFTDLKFEHINELHLDHPGANDEAYRTRRNYIAQCAKSFRETGIIKDVEYTPREQRVWRYVAEELEELQQKYASPFYLRAKKDLGITTDKIPQLTEMNRRLKELTGFRLAPIEGLVETRGFLSWLSYRVMLCTQYIRHHSHPAYTPEEVKKLEAAVVAEVEEGNADTDPNAPAEAPKVVSANVRPEFAAAGGDVGGYNRGWLDPGSAEVAGR